MGVTSRPMTADELLRVPAIEVLSPGDTVFGVDEKVAAWLTAGARGVWVVNPQRRTITVHRAASQACVLSEDDTLDGEDLVPGFRVPVAVIFAA